MNSSRRHDLSRSFYAVVAAALLLLPVAQGATLAVANKAEATVSLIDLDSGTVVATLPTGEGPHEIGISADGRFALVTNYGTREQGGNSLTLIDIPAASVVKTIDLGDYRRPHGVEWLDDESVVVTVEANNALIVVDVARDKVTQSIGTDQEVSHMVALDPERGRAYTANIGSGSVSVLDLGKGTLKTNVATGEGAEGIAVSASGEHIWVTNRAADTITILEADSLEPAGEIAS